MRKREPATRSDDAIAKRPVQQSVKGNVAKANYNTHIIQEPDLFVEPWCAVGEFLGGRLVAGRGATGDGGDPQVMQLHAIVSRTGVGLRGKSDVVKHRKQKIPGTLTCEPAARAVGA